MFKYDLCGTCVMDRLSCEMFSVIVLLHLRANLILL